MDFDEQQLIWIAYLISNLVGLLFLLAAIKRPKLARLMFLILFGWASWFNYTTSHKQPEVYLMYADKSMDIYSEFINGWFRAHVTPFVTFIAIGQGLIALGILLNGLWVKLACVGVIIFLMAIAPLGFYAAFPFSVTVSIAAYLVMKKDDKDYLWKFKKLQLN